MKPMSKATLSIASKNYGSWSLRGWLVCKMAGLDFDEQGAPSDDPSTKAELLVLLQSFLVPGALALDRRPEGVGHARDNRISQRAVPRGGPAAAGRGSARALSLGVG